VVKGELRPAAARPVARCWGQRHPLPLELVADDRRVAGLVSAPGEPLDHGGDAHKGPVVGVEAVRAAALAHRLVDGGELLAGQARGRPGRASAPHSLQAAGVPAGLPLSVSLAPP
jgi:hypothetical protein